MLTLRLVNIEIGNIEMLTDVHYMRCETRTEHKADQMSTNVFFLPRPVEKWFIASSVCVMSRMPSHIMERRNDTRHHHGVIIME